METKYADGLYFNEPHQNAPDFVIGSMSINRERFIAWLGQQELDGKGYVKLQILKSKKGKPYVALNTFVPKSDVPKDVPIIKLDDNITNVTF